MSDDTPELVEEWRQLGCAINHVYAIAEHELHTIKNRNAGHHCDYRNALHSIRDLCKKVIAGHGLEDCGLRTAVPKCLEKV